MDSKEKYRKEQVIAKLLALFEAQEQVAALYMELCENFPEAAKMLDEKDPSLAALRKEAERRWVERQEK